MTARYPLPMFFVTMPAPASPPEEDLVRSAGGGDRAAFGELYNRYVRVVHAILLARVPVGDAEDLVQEVFIAALRKLPLLRSPGAFAGWLAAIARNRAIEFHRSSRHMGDTAERLVAEPRAGHDEAFVVLDAIRTLPEAYRETLLLRLVEGMTGPEIAERTGLTPDSVRVNLSRGMKLLRERLGGDRNL